ncbi:hypothetical protein GCM10009825_17120 [Arthrobacter humicola]|uniref:Uncharacterized protein n=1 Tax=Arthrobacter humicola TaxID=409291 RepID=A0ABN2YXH8_9MICC
MKLSAAGKREQAKGSRQKRAGKREEAKGSGKPPQATREPRPSLAGEPGLSRLAGAGGTCA